MNYFPREGNKKCLNGRTSLKVDLDYVNDFMEKYKESGFFGLMFFADYSHSNSYYLNQIDTDIYDFLKKFNENKAMSSSTILIVFSDHGPRFSENRKSMKGKDFISF
jgi:membrane-anchored protein YejM (alkaline phosphatase superfamily)